MSFLKCIPAVIGRFVVSVIRLAPCELSERRVNRKVDHVTVTLTACLREQLF